MRYSIIFITCGTYNETYVQTRKQLPTIEQVYILIIHRKRCWWLTGDNGNYNNFCLAIDMKKLKVYSSTVNIYEELNIICVDAKKTDSVTKEN